MMDKEDLIKLAEIAGYSFKKATDKKSHSSFERADQLIHTVKLDISFIYWQPHKDIAQAFEVLEGLGKDYDISCIGKTEPRQDGIVAYEVTINPEYRGEECYLGENLPEAICQAVLKASNEQGGGDE